MCYHGDSLVVCGRAYEDLPDEIALAAPLLPVPVSASVTARSGEIQRAATSGVTTRSRHTLVRGNRR